MSKVSRLKFSLLTDDIRDHRYASIDDWWDGKQWTGEMYFKAVTADTGNRKYNFLILLHALVEQYLCFEHGIKDEEVTKFDREHTHCDDPGSHIEAPYHEEHRIAEEVESLVSVQMGVDWVKYGKTIDKILKKYKK